MLKLNNVSKYYYNKGVITSGLNGIDLEFEKGEFVVITGESGSGKSTLLNVISSLDTYEEGEMYIEGKETSHYTTEDLERYRQRYIANVFQEYNLINSYSVFQNVEIALLINGQRRKEVKRIVKDIIEKVGLTKFTRTKASKLSGGQMQRVSIARALAKGTDIIIADEPTGNLDSQSAKEICELLAQSSEKLVIVVTHNYEQFEQYATRKITMRDGRVVEDERRKREVVQTENKEPVSNQEKSGEKNNTVPKKRMRMSPMALLRIGARNTTNIFSKFILIMLVLAFFVVSIAFQYTAFRQNESAASMFGYNPYFYSQDNSRIILSKSDNTAFTEDDYTAVQQIANIKDFTKYDTLLDNIMVVEQLSYYAELTPIDVNDFSGELSYGRLPESENEMILLTTEADLTYIDVDMMLQEDASIYSYFMPTSERIVGNKIVGIAIYEHLYQEELKEGNTVFSGNSYDSYANQYGLYMHPSQLDYLNSLVYKTYTDLTVTIKNVNFDYFKDTYVVQALSSVPAGKVIIDEYLSYQIDTESITSETLNMNASNLYYQHTASFGIHDTFNEEDYKKVLGISETQFFESRATIYMNPTDFASLYRNDIYQVSIFVEDMYAFDETIASIESSGYEHFALLDTMAGGFDPGFDVVYNIMQTIFVVVSVIIVFFVSYFVLRLILRSRNRYYATLRILGMNNKTTKKLLDIELLVDGHIVFVAFVGVVYMLQNAMIGNEYFITLASFFGRTQIVVLYLTVMIMLLLLSRRITSKLFKNSSMSAYREEAM